MPESRDAGLILNLNLLPGGTAKGSWRLDDRDPSWFVSHHHYVEAAQIAERGKFQAVFLADTPAWDDAYWHHPWRALTPFIALTAIAARTDRVGLIGTASTSYNDPFNLARQVASLDLVSDGRAAWNYVVTAGDRPARNFSRAQADPKDERYARAEEFVDAVVALWEAWEPDPIAGDRTVGDYLRPGAIRPAAFAGERIQVAGEPLVPPSPQGRPLLVQAGASERGIALAARTADAVYTHQTEIDDGVVYRNLLRGKAANAGRDPHTLKVLPGFFVVIGDTETAARQRHQELTEATPDAVRLSFFARQLGIPVSEFHIDRPLPFDLIAKAEISRTAASELDRLLDAAARDNLTAREVLALRHNGTQHVSVIGTPEQVADTITAWYLAGAADGFNLHVASSPSVLTDFVDHVVPLLQAGGVFHHDYEGTTLREHYGLAPHRLSAGVLSS
ncbi:FMN-dependent oxidoreductase, nitrilotriacetate monooxygenase family [Mycolicibacterium aurum]|uniref:FMN-dependent oxidoreductase, nitrilotriacetate monooxygenase family n=1 Tax=Mycolicibacterium aurum TaxID=1791 RepID=A0A3S4RYC4_MYCAU|nr:NtaA/DmoA family FMN-dependent monooxygenase [Mycolicibacterium aurum]VEG51847.1 FMN-dependent oxidoreductase, nitrilotriacetate monooxygenase family [Mycolicibacterium aurum]